MKYENLEIGDILYICYSSNYGKDELIITKVTATTDETIALSDLYSSLDAIDEDWVLKFRGNYINQYKLLKVLGKNLTLLDIKQKYPELFL